MIIASSAAALRYSTDPMANNLRSFVAAPAIRLANRPASASTANSSRDLRELYPSLFSNEQPPSVGLRSMRAVAFRIAVFAAATLFAIKHH